MARFMTFLEHDILHIANLRDKCSRGDQCYSEDEISWDKKSRSALMSQCFPHGVSPFLRNAPPPSVTPAL
jgi:hypothetical protein